VLSYSDFSTRCGPNHPDPQEWSIAEGRLPSRNCQKRNSASHPPEIVITDEHLPGRTGRELLKTLREDGLESTVFALTGSIGEDFEVRFLFASGDGIMLKPFNRAGLLACLNSAKRSATMR
jgi:DNA-binding response OmpR family regulator